MGRLINIDNGGTLTDICVWDGDRVSYTKTLTTPFDLSQCLFDGIEKVSGEATGVTDLAGFLSGARHVRYSTTQGTNALVERKGPKIGLITDDDALVDQMNRTEVERDLFSGLVGGRTAVIDTAVDDEQLAEGLVQVVNRLTTQGAARLVVGLVSDGEAQERRVRSVLLRAFPRHLLGSVPVLYSSDFAADRDHPRRVWSSIINSFLHPTIERFLYNTEHRLRGHRVRNPLLIYRNDGASSRVAKSVALKTYSSGPRGGLEGTKALAEAYDLKTVLMIDVGGTTTDVGVVENAEIATRRRGEVRGVEVSFPLSDVQSAGVGGSSIIAVVDGRIQVGPRSVGAAPGPACFGFGGEHATITDVNLLLGVLDADTYLDGALTLDPQRSAAVIRKTIADPLGISLEEALVQAEHAYFEAIAASFADAITDASTTTVAAFGGAGPMSAAGAARINGVRQVLVPKLAAVFSAFGIGFSDVSQSYEVVIDDGSADAVRAKYDEMLARARRDLYQEGHDLEDCTIESVISVERDGEQPSSSAYAPGDEIAPEPNTQTTLTLTATHELPHVHIAPDSAGEPVDAVPTAHRTIRSTADRVDEVPVYTLVDQPAGARASGPAIVEGPFFTARVLKGWDFRVTTAGDLLLTDTTPSA
ncbi:hydantoinase/oxoprolinase family protein [Pseudoclavibacter sp. 13-3]|uniref:hydantoinase/oxoprolinase family protein n=1 Tax=Pseudoclavibacter sp. 13-3 TaxID=2901228 RepID=UPI001E3D172C|nr:hydantoinase/oxoprolinase family protein [Pseudoclavibacter sp. 13-3]MCD7100766.1 hydantoinase/oxoprolinase family protein [Pseudoclavibacter sp. 13-3]